MYAVGNPPSAVFKGKTGSWDFRTQHRRHFTTLKSNNCQAQCCQIEFLVGPKFCLKNPYRLSPHAVLPQDAAIKLNW